MAHRFPTGWTGADIVFLDCDSTLSTLEGIDEIALRRGVDTSRLTADSMSGRADLGEVYRERLEAVRPQRADLDELADLYLQTVVPGARELVQALDALDIQCHLISGGLLPAVMPFAIALGFREDRVHAVGYPVDAQDPVAIACAHPLSRNGGKPEVVATVCADGPPRARRMLAGDGTSDLEAASQVGLFVGFGGVEDRPPVREAADVFLASEGLWGLGVLAAGPARIEELMDVAPLLYMKADALLQTPDLLVIQP